MTGWGQDGPLAQRAGHDINYLGLTGALHAIGTGGQAGRAAEPRRATSAAASMYLLVGVLAALRRAGHAAAAARSWTPRWSTARAPWSR